MIDSKSIGEQIVDAVEDLVDEELRVQLQRLEHRMDFTFAFHFTKTLAERGRERASTEVFPAREMGKNRRLAVFELELTKRRASNLWAGLVQFMQRLVRFKEESHFPVQ